MELDNFISQIHRIDHIILKLTPRDTAEDTPITVVATYAHHTGYSNEEKKNTGANSTAPSP